MTDLAPDGCPCPTPSRFEPQPPAGLSRLSLDGGGFDQYRDRLRDELRRTATAWRPGSTGDLAEMLFDAWAYVLDVTGFYDSRAAERAFLSTAPMDRVAADLVSLLGHRPRPAMAARATLALAADDGRAVIPVGAAFRSEPVAGGPPQVFETVERSEIWAAHNRFEPHPVHADAFDGILRVPASVAPAVGSLVIVHHGSVARHAGRVAGLRDDDFERPGVVVVDLEPPLTSEASGPARLEMVRQDIIPTWTSRSTATIEGRVPLLRASDVVVLEAENGVLAAASVAVTEKMVPWSDDPNVTIPNTTITLTGSATGGVGTRVWFDRRVLGPLSGALDASVDRARLAAGVEIDAIELDGAPRAFRAAVHGAGATAIEVDAFVQSDAAGSRLSAATPLDFSFDGDVVIRGNLIEVVRGETVRDEPLGVVGANPGTPEFELRKTPLTWVADGSTRDGRRPELAVRVDGVEWRWVERLYAAPPDDRVYEAVPSVDGTVTVRFGDGVTGLRPAVGASVTATYRHGAGAATVPRDEIGAMVGRIEGVDGVTASSPSVGGADPETAAELRRSGPTAALTTGRAVSLFDFAAMARTFGGVANAAAEWRWEHGRQRVAVHVWMVPTVEVDPPEVAGLAAELESWLVARCAPGLDVAVAPATPAPNRRLAIILEYDDGVDRGRVRETVRAALFDGGEAPLSRFVQEIGRPLYRSQLIARIQDVSGVRSVTSVQVDGQSLAFALPAGTGGWFLFPDGVGID